MRTTWGLLGATCAGLAVRLLGVDRPSLWYDEALEYERATGSLQTLIFGRPVDQDPPFWALFNHLWFTQGTDEFWLRVPSVLLGAAAVFVAGSWSARRFGQPVGLLTALFIALAPVHVHYSQELNQYAAVVFLTLVAILAWERLLARGRPVDWARYTAVSAVGLTTHYGLAFPLAAMGLYLAHHVFRFRPRDDRRLLAAYASACAIIVVALFWFGLAERIAMPHLQRRFGGTHLAKELGYIADIGWREILVFFLLPFSGGPALWAVSALAVVAAVGAIRLWRLGPNGRRTVGICFFGALAVTYPADGLGLYPMGHRYVLFASPPLFAALAAGVGGLWQHARSLGILATLATTVVFLAFAPHELWPNPWLTVPREELRPVVESVTTAREPEELIYVYFGAIPAFRYYYRGSDKAVLWGRNLAEGGHAGEAQRISASKTHPDVWLVFSHERAGDREALLAALEERGLRLTAEVKGRNAGAVRLSRQPVGQASP